jgi:hypothetical protein
VKGALFHHLGRFKDRSFSSEKIFVRYASRQSKGSSSKKDGSRIISLETNVPHVSLQTAFSVHFHQTAIEFHYEIKDLYYQNQFVHKVDEQM